MMGYTQRWKHLDDDVLLHHKWQTCSSSSRTSQISNDSSRSIDITGAGTANSNVNEKEDDDHRPMYWNLVKYSYL